MGMREGRTDEEGAGAEREREGWSTYSLTHKQITKY